MNTPTSINTIFFVFITMLSSIFAIEGYFAMTLIPRRLRVKLCEQNSTLPACDTLVNTSNVKRKTDYFPDWLLQSQMCKFRPDLKLCNNAFFRDASRKSLGRLNLRLPIYESSRENNEFNEPTFQELKKKQLFNPFKPLSNSSTAKFELTESTTLVPTNRTLTTLKNGNTSVSTTTVATLHTTKLNAITSSSNESVELDEHDSGYDTSGTTQSSNITNTNNLSTSDPDSAEVEDSEENKTTVIPNTVISSTESILDTNTTFSTTVAFNSTKKSEEENEVSDSDEENVK